MLTLIGIAASRIGIQPISLVLAALIYLVVEVECNTVVDDGSGLHCVECQWFQLEDEPQFYLQDVANRLMRRSELSCKKPQEHSPRHSCPSVDGHAARCMLINGSMLASEALGGIKFSVKVRRCVSLKYGDPYLRDSARCYSNPRFRSTLYDVTDDLFNGLSDVHLSGGVCFCDSNICNSAASSALHLLIFTLAVTLHYL